RRDLVADLADLAVRLGDGALGGLERLPDHLRYEARRGGGTIVAIVQVFVAGVWSTFPAASLARTAKVCVPAASPEKLVGEGQAAKAAESSEQAKLEPASLDVKLKLALEELGEGAPEVIVVS